MLREQLQPTGHVTPNPAPSSSRRNVSTPGARANRFISPGLITVRFGNRLRSLRLERGLTQDGLAKLLGIDRSFISDVERGKKAMNLSYLQTVAQGFGLSLAELFQDI